MVLRCGFCAALVVLCFARISESAPVTNENGIEWEDTWEFRILPHSTPLLNDSTNHTLPVFYQFAKDLKVEGIGRTPVDGAAKRNPKEVAGDVIKTKVSCGVCKLGVGLLYQEVKNNTPFEDIKAKFVSLCVAFKVESLSVCTGIFDVYGPEVVPAVKVSDIGPQEICSLIFGETCGDVEIPPHEWTVELPNVPKPQMFKPQLPQPGLPTFKVLHISDTHYDPEYLAGTPSNCEEPLCCKSYSTPSTTEPNEPAGKWGSHSKCDSPKILIDNMLQNIALEHPDIDYVLWTGDLPPHDVWNQSKQNNLDIIRATVEQMFEVFPTTPIFPAIGNHESSPAGNFAPPWMKDEEHSVSWLYSEIADHWRKWLPNSVGNTVQHGAFYSVLLRPGFRLISLNTNYCHSLSWWLLVNSTDPAKELQWLVYELQQAEDKGEKVHIIGHIPPGSTDCMKTWSKNFYAIVERYENTIAAQFYGHSHADEYELFYETTEYSRPTNVAYLAPSVTTYENFNPAYRIYYVDGDHETTTREVLDHETWTTDLEEANSGPGEPRWFKLYSAKDEYKMDSLRPEAWNKLIEQMVDDEDLFDLFYRNYYRASPKMPHCGSKCKLQILCDLKSGKSHSRKQLCHELQLAFGI